MGLSVSLQTFFERYSYDQTQSVDKKGLGSVYLGEDKSSNQKVVVKTVELHQNWDNNQLVERYENSQQYTHPNLLPCLNYIREMEGAIAQYWAVFPYIERGSLDSYHTDSWSRVHRSNVLEGIMDALIHLHENGMVAQNLSAGHVLLQKIEDIYTPKLIHATNRQRLPLSFFADYGYLAPEQFEEAYTPDTKTDIWAFGVLAYEHFIGRLPFGTRDSRTSNEQIQRRIQKAVLPTRIDELPIVWKKIVEKCLLLPPNERWESVKEIRAYWLTHKKAYLAGGEEYIYNHEEPVEEVIQQVATAKTIAKSTKKVTTAKEPPRRTFKRKPTPPIKWSRVGIAFIVAIVLGFLLSQWAESDKDIPTNSKPEQDSIRLNK